MKKVILSVAIIAAMVFTGCKSEKKDTTKVDQTETKMATIDATFGVRGNCGMCKTTFEGAVTSLDGVTSANWDKARKKIDVSFDDSKTNLDAIHKAIANSGYDTDKVAGNEEAYKDLPGCCQYDHTMEMSLAEALNDDTDKGDH